MEQAPYDHPEAYDALYWAKDYVGETAFMLERSTAYGNDGTDALIIGCGTGRHSAHLREAGFDVLGVDPNPAMLKAAQARSDATFETGGLPDFRVDGTFDLVWAPFTVLNYLAPDDVEPALDALAAVLAKNWLLVVDLGAFPNMTSPRLEIAPGDDGGYARLPQFYRPDDGPCVMMDALVFTSEEWFVDRHTLTAVPETIVTGALAERGFTVDGYGWYGSSSIGMDDPAVVVAYRDR